MSENIYIVDNYDSEFNKEDLAILLLDNIWKSFYVDSKTSRLDEDNEWLNSIREHIELNYKKHNFLYRYDKNTFKYVFTLV